MLRHILYVRDWLQFQMLSNAEGDLAQKQNITFRV
jgi:hypothetical protein